MKRTPYLMIWPRCSKLLLDSEIWLRHRDTWLNLKEKKNFTTFKFCIFLQHLKKCEIQMSRCLLFYCTWQKYCNVFVFVEFYICIYLNTKKNVVETIFVLQINCLFAISGVSLDFVVSVSTLHLRKKTQMCF